MSEDSSSSSESNKSKSICSTRKKKKFIDKYNLTVANEVDMIYKDDKLFVHIVRSNQVMASESVGNCMANQLIGPKESRREENANNSSRN